MLGVNKYTQGYIDGCRARVDSSVSAYRDMVSASTKLRPANDGAQLTSATEALETAFFNNMVLLLDYMFAHRLRVIEGKDGNSLNEVRIMCNSLLNNDGTMTPEKSIKLSPRPRCSATRWGRRSR